MSQNLHNLAKKLAPKFKDTTKFVSEDEIQSIYIILKQIIQKDYWYFSERFESKIDLIKLLIHIIGVIKNIPLPQIEQLISAAKLLYIFEIESDEFVDEECDECDGRGETYCQYCDDGNQECGECGSEGKIDCPACGGEGTNAQGDDCAECNGESQIECSNCEGSGYETCSNCDGNGRVECDYCDGAGQIETENYPYDSWVFLSWDNEFNQECEMKMELEEPLDMDFKSRKMIYLSMVQSNAKFYQLKNIQIEKDYCYKITPLEELSAREVSLSPKGALQFRSSDPTDFL